MSAPKTKPAANGTKKPHAPAAKDSAAPVPSAPVNAPVSSSGKPDKAVYDAEQQRIKDEINLLQEKLVRHDSGLHYRCIHYGQCLDYCEGENLYGH
jgi:hypothetical protein